MQNVNNYTDQLLMVVVVLLYFLNYFYGLYKNSKLAHVWLEMAKGRLSAAYPFENKDFEEAGYFNRFEFMYLCRGNTYSNYLIITLSLKKRFEMLTFFFSTLCRATTDKIWLEIPLKLD